MNQGAVSLKIQVQSMNSGLFHMAANRYVHEMEHVSNLPCEGDVYVTNAFIRRTGLRENYRPCLALIGEVKQIKGQFPCGVSVVEFGDGPDRPKVSYEYRLTNKELAKLCMAGMFDDGFRCPDVFFHNTFQLPMTCDCSALPPETEDDVPLLFVNINKPNMLTTSSRQSGYEIDEYFHEKPEEEYGPEVADEEDIVEDLRPDVVPEPAPSYVPDIVDDYVSDEPASVVTENRSFMELTDEDKLLDQALARIENRKKKKLEEEKAEKAADEKAKAEQEEDQEDDKDDRVKTLSEDTVDKNVQVPEALTQMPVEHKVSKPVEPVAVPQVRHYDDIDEDDDIEDYVGEEDDEYDL